MQWHSIVNESTALVAHALHGLEVVSQRLDGPPLRNLAEVGVDETRGKDVRDGAGKTGIAAFGLCTNRPEVDEPVLEQRPRHRLQCLVHPKN